MSDGREALGDSRGRETLRDILAIALTHTIIIKTMPVLPYACMLILRLYNWMCYTFKQG